MQDRKTDKPSITASLLVSHLALATHQPSGADQLDGVAEGRLHADAGQDGVRLLAQLHVLLLTPEMTQPVRLHSFSLHTPGNCKDRG